MTIMEKKCFYLLFPVCFFFRLKDYKIPRFAGDVDAKHGPYRHDDR